MALIDGRRFVGDYPGPKEVRYLFIDGGCLKASLEELAKRYGLNDKVEIDFGKLSDGYSKAFYYDGFPVQFPEEPKDQYENRVSAKKAELDAIRRIDKFHVYEGDARQRSGGRGLEQKKVDILIAVDMLTHTFRRNMHEATLLTGDLDFRPLLDALVANGMFVSLCYPPNRTNPELLHAADRRLPFDIRAAYANATTDCRNRWKLPEVQEGYFRLESEVIASWSNEAGTEFILQKRDAKWFRVSVTPRHFRPAHVEHEDIGILKLYLADVFDSQIPEDVVAKALPKAF